MADITREEIERIRDVANTSSNPAIHVADIISICDLALAALAPAAEPTREPDAWLYTCGKPGLRSTWASIDANDASHWPIDQWTNGYEKRPLYLASPIQPLGVLHQTPDGRVFKSFPSTDAAQTPSEALELATALESNSATEYDRWRAAHLLRCQYAPPQAPSEAVARDFKALYMELLYAIGKKHHGESRHETALRYIQQAESPRASDSQACDASPSAGTPEEEK